MQNIQLIIGACIAVSLGSLLINQFKKKQNALKHQATDFLFREISSVIESPRISSGEAIGTWKLHGKYNGKNIQIQTIVDTLAVRKLPILWLMVTLQEPQPVSANTDLMMRPAGPTSFSNFDFLAHTISTPVGFPQHAVIRTDVADFVPPFAVILPNLALFEEGKGKELLVSPKGLRIVALAAQADRARYGVFREANFGTTVISKELVVNILNTLLNIEKALAAGNA